MKIIAGVDEVGRGSLIGPVYAAAVILNKTINLKYLKDSKKLTKEKREFLSNYIKKIRTGDPNESDITYWMFSYDFKSQNKDWVPEDNNLRLRKRSRNTLIFLLYLNVFCIFLLFNSFIAHLLEVIVHQQFSYPV